jgi:hypothetical protein
MAVASALGIRVPGLAGGCRRMKDSTVSCLPPLQQSAQGCKGGMSGQLANACLVVCSASDGQ